MAEIVLKQCISNQEHSLKDLLLMYARYNKRADASVLTLLDGLSREACEEDRKSFCGSLSGLAKHLLEGTTYFHGLFRASLPAKATAALAATSGLAIPAGSLSALQWQDAKAAIEAADQATIDLVQALDERECGLPVALDWYDGKPASVPFHFLANHLFVHGTHHRGQISQILDELGVEHDFSGIDLEFMPA
jgi:uncharacterized damage-inducible protein DinB